MTLPIIKWWTHWGKSLQPLQGLSQKQQAPTRTRVYPRSSRTQPCRPSVLTTYIPSPHRSRAPWHPLSVSSLGSAFSRPPSTHYGGRLGMGEDTASAAHSRGPTPEEARPHRGPNPREARSSVLYQWQRCRVQQAIVTGIGSRTFRLNCLVVEEWRCHSGTQVTGLCGNKQVWECSLQLAGPHPARASPQQADPNPTRCDPVCRFTWAVLSAVCFAWATFGSLRVRARIHPPQPVA